MKLSPLFERISLVPKAKQLSFDAIESMRVPVANKIIDIEDQLNTDASEQSTQAEFRQDIATVAKAVAPIVIAELKKIIGALGGQGITFRFKKLDSGKAEYDHDERLITFAPVTIGAFSKGIVQELGKGTDPNRLLDKQAVQDGFGRLVELLVHELVHGEQFSRSKIQYPYRSYLMKNKDEFHAHDQLDAPYYASPEEIGAYAQQQALVLIRNVSAASGSKQEKIAAVTQLMQSLSTKDTDYDMFKQFPGKLGYQVRNRYIKKIYAELEAYRDSLTG